MNVRHLCLRKHVVLITCAFVFALLLTFGSLAAGLAFGVSKVTNAMVVGKVISVSTTEQKLDAYENGNVVYSTLVQTGRGSLPTPLGTFHVFVKLSPTIFRSPWPEGSANWYPPTHINYALEFLSGGFFLHDATWHSVFGPGTNDWHHDPRFGWQNGSHGCVAMPLSAAAWLYNWAPIGTTVNIHA
jgi:lipoprotein-anchoring transpeptidase ErfK/SrfK